MNNKINVLIIIATLLVLAFTNSSLSEQISYSETEQIEQLKVENANLKKQLDDKKEWRIMERVIYTLIFFFACWCLWQQLVYKKRLSQKQIG